MRSILGLCSYEYYRRFLKCFAMIVAKLHLTKKEHKFELIREAQEAFEKLKKTLINPLVLTYQDPSKPFILDCGASDDGIGSVLSQKCVDAERVLAYFCKKLIPAEKKYCMTRKGLLAVAKKIDFVHPDLYHAMLYHPYRSSGAAVAKVLEKAISLLA